MVTQWFLVSLMPLSNVVERRGPLPKEPATPTAPRVRVLSGHPSDSLVFSYSCPRKINFTSLPAKSNQTGCQWSLPLTPSPRNIERNCITVRGTSWSARPIATTKSWRKSDREAWVGCLDPVTRKKARNRDLPSTEGYSGYRVHNDRGQQISCTKKETRAGLATEPTLAGSIRGSPGVASALRCDVSD